MLTISLSLRISTAHRVYGNEGYGGCGGLPAALAEARSGSRQAYSDEPTSGSFAMGIAIWVLKAYAAGPRELRQRSCHDAPPERPATIAHRRGTQPAHSHQPLPRRKPASHVARAKALLAVAEGKSYTAEAAKVAGRRSGDAVSQLWSGASTEKVWLL